jgi:uncharacterized protein YbjT (DUF2867 family)
MSTIFVTGATGRVGRHVISGLLERDVEVRALTRHPDTAGRPAGVDVVAGDVADTQDLANHLNGVDAVFLLWPFFGADGADEVVATLAARAQRIVYLSAEAAGKRPDSFWATVERAIERSAAEWTFLRPTGFAANTLMWADQIRASGVVRWPYGHAARSLIHERDIAAVAVRALTENGHHAARYVLTGPAAITQIAQAGAIGDALGRRVSWEELSREEAEQQITGLPDTALDTWASFVETPEVVTSVVEQLTGEPATPFYQWARDHVEDFR